MIKSFADNRTENLFQGYAVKKIDKNIQKQALRRLQYIHAAISLNDLMVPPSNHLERKQGDLNDYYAIWVNKQWRIIFKWNDGNAYDVQFIDYH